MHLPCPLSFRQAILKLLQTDKHLLWYIMNKMSFGCGHIWIWCICSPIERKVKLWTEKRLPCCAYVVFQMVCVCVCVYTHMCAIFVTVSVVCVYDICASTTLWHDGFPCRFKCGVNYCFWQLPYFTPSVPSYPQLCTHTHTHAPTLTHSGRSGRVEATVSDLSKSNLISFSKTNRPAIFSPLRAAKMDKYINT